MKICLILLSFSLSVISNDLKTEAKKLLETVNQKEQLSRPLIGRIINLKKTAEESLSASQEISKITTTQIATHVILDRRVSYEGYEMELIGLPIDKINDASAALTILNSIIDSPKFRGAQSLTPRSSTSSPTVDLSSSLDSHNSILAVRNTKKR